MKRGIILFIFIILLLATSVNALDVTSKPIKNVFLPNEDVVMNLEITNNDEGDEFKITTLDVGWQLSTEPKVISIAGRSTKYVKVTLSPIGTKGSKTYNVPIRIAGVETTAKADHNLVFQIIGFNEIINVLVEEASLQPKEDNRIILRLENRNNVEYKNVKLKISGDVLNAERTLNFKPNEIRKETFDFKMGSDVREGKQELDIVILDKGNEIFNGKRDVYVGVYSNIKEGEEFKSGFLIKKIILERVNNGNKISKEVYSTRISSFNKIFTNFNPEPNTLIKEDNYYTAEWNFNLEPGKSYKIVVETNYGRPILYLILFIILMLIIYYLVRSDVSLHKKVLAIKTKEGISDMKVLLVIKNRGTEVKDIKILDNLPRVVKEPTEYGPLKPSRIKKGAFGLQLMWELPNLIKGDERIITYRIRSRVNIIGKLIIPRAVCSYKNIKGRRVTTHSPRITLFGG